MQLHNITSTIIDFVVISIILKFIIAKWIAEQIKRLFMWGFVRSERDLAIWLHYRNQALNGQHSHSKK